MTPYHLGRGSLRKLRGVHPDLYSVIHLAITLTPVDFAVTCGPRTIAAQARNVASGASKTMNSRHIRKQCAGFGQVCFAIDFVPWIDGAADYQDIGAMKQIVQAIKHAAEILGIPVESGGEMWGWDWFHIQLPRKTYR